MTAPALFRKKPVEVHAIQWTGDNAAAVAEFTGRDKFDAFTEPCDDDADFPDHVQGDSENPLLEAALAVYQEAL